MKKIVAVMLIFMLLALGGCGEKKNVLEVTEFSQETQNVLQILQNRIYFLIILSMKALRLQLLSFGVVPTEFGKAAARVMAI